VAMNGHLIRGLMANSYIYRSSGSGRLTVQVGDQASLPIQVQSGRIYFVRLTVAADGSNELKLVSYGAGRRDLHHARLLKEQKVVARKARPTSRPAPAPEARRETATAPTTGGRGGFNLIFKGGSFSLASANQNIDADAGGAVVTFATSFAGSGGVYGLEGEWVGESGWAFGGELLMHKHNYTTIPAGTIGSGDMQIVTIAVNSRKYFRPGSVVQPFLGAGLGVVTATLSGQLEGTGTGFVIQGMGGVAFRWEHIGLYTELKYQFAETADISASGPAFLAGIGIQF